MGKTGGVSPSHMEWGCLRAKQSRDAWEGKDAEPLTRQGLLKDSQTEPALPTDLMLRGAGECPRLKGNPVLIPAVHIHNAGSRKGTAEE